MMEYDLHKLKNGLNTIIAPLRSTEAITVLFLVKTGSKYEKKDEAGISHFLEHMFFKGTARRPNTFAISEALDKVGGIYNAYTDKEYTGFYIKVACSHLTLALDVLSDMLLNSRFDQKEVEKEKGVILEEIKLYQDMPTAYVGQLFEKLLYGDTPAGRDIIGTPKTVSSFTSRDLKNYMASHYSSRNSLLVVAGKLEKEATLEKLKKYFSSFPSIPTPKKPVVEEKQTLPSILRFKKATDQTHLCLGVRTFNIFDERRYALALIDAVLGGGMSSRLFINIREKRGLAYYVKSRQELYDDSGYFVVQAGIAHKNIKKVVKLILDEFNALKNFSVSDKELTKAKEYLKGVTLLGLETSDAVASFLGKQKLLKNELLSPEEIFKRLEQWTPKKIKEIAQTVFIPQSLNLALITPLAIQHKNIKKILSFN